MWCMKKCFKCGERKAISEFYRHPAMGDGHLGKCKECTKKDTNDRRLRLEATDLEWVESELARRRLKSKRHVLEGRKKPLTPEKRRIVMDKYDAKHPNRRKATNAVNNAVRDGRLQKLPCSICGKRDSEGHHDDYNKPLDVIWLCSKHHAERHILLRQQQRALRYKLAATP